ncbi:MAG: NAD(P)-dependent oxidoreductase [Calditrichaeota bacterium]|nr:MAG: NAD(P)-dependent oxidoreductase [Calditrichota bacterium]
MIKTILITGSSGTVGTALVKSLQSSKKYKLTLIDKKKSIWDESINKKTVFHDLTKPIPKGIIGQKPDLIIHLAAHARVHDLVVDPQKALDNYLMTHNLLEFARMNNTKRFVFASSREVYGESTSKGKRKESSTHVTKIKSPYTASKFAAEALIHSYGECYGIKPVIVRLSNVYGKYDISERVIPLFIYYALRNRHIKVFGADKKLDFTYIDDVVTGFEQLIKQYDKIAPDTFNLSGGKGTTILDVAKTIVKSLDSKSKISITKKRVGEISQYIGDISNAHKKFGYTPKVLVTKGLQLNIEFYMKIMESKKHLNYQIKELEKRGWA